MADSLKLEAPWETVKELLKEVNTDLTDEDLEFTEGQEEKLLERVAKKMHRTPDEARMLIESISSNSGKAG